MINPQKVFAAKQKWFQLAMAPVLMQAVLPVYAQNNELETLTVTAEALKIESPAIETPLSISVVSEDDLRIRAPQKLDEALRYTAGVTAQPFGADNDTDWFRVRGFEATTYLDGNRLFRDGYYTWLVEPFGLEAVEVIKGPASILYGESAPGGIVNAIQKKPKSEPQGTVRIEVGNNNHQAVGFDISDIADDEGNVKFRLVGLKKSEDGQLDDTKNERFFVAPTVEINFNNQTTLTILSSYLQDDGVPTNPFFPAAGTLIESDFGKIDPSTNLGQPSYDDYERTQVSLGYQIDHHINDTWDFSQNLNYGYNELLLVSSYAFFNNDPSADTLGQGAVFRDGDTQSVTFDNNVVGNWNTENLKHTVLLGIDLQHHKTEGDEQDSFAFGTINPFTPVYGNFTPLDSANDVAREITKTQASAYSQYKLTVHDKWIGNIGARFDKVKTENEGNGPFTQQNESRNDSQVSLSAGILFLADNGLTPYVSYAESFEVISTIDFATGELYEPLEGEQIEVGVKYLPNGFDGYINLAWFDITQKNALVTNPDTFIATQTGEVTSQGFEIEGSANITQNLKLLANLTHTKAETDETSGQGTQQAGLIPEKQASIWVDYHASAMLQGLNLGTGVRYIGESKDNPRSSDLTVPSQTLWDASVGYTINSQWEAQLNVNNILDEEYISGCDYWCYFGQARSVMLSLNHSW